MSKDTEQVLREKAILEASLKRVKERGPEANMKEGEQEIEQETSLATVARSVVHLVEFILDQDSDLIGKTGKMDKRSTVSLFVSVMAAIKAYEDVVVDRERRAKP